ncbi:PAS domain S-box-containing protein [Actinoplanes tereljensis]|uniref:PAS domain S-box protein n=1 Tax=Paractinoplanes tereljensis TaxID=571912 RepID=UPI001EF36628|nr:PAS domain S-box protein [Actinoplanes tereljensis]
MKLPAEMLAAIVEQSSDAIIASTLDGTITLWNAGAERIYGYSAGEALGRHLSEFILPGRVAALDASLAKLAAGQHVQLDEVPRAHRDGTAVLVSVLVSPIRDEHGRVVAVAATERDITDQKRRETESARAARLAGLGQLAGGIAHDFNNLLAIILNYADFLAEEVSGEGAHDLARIRDAADRARSLTGQLLLFAKREPTQVAVVELNEVVTEAGELLSRTIGAQIELVCRPCAGRIPVLANRGRLDQILLNLVINARDAMPDGGVVMLATELAEICADGPLPPGRYARLEVSDTGTGMTAEVRDRLFEPFFTTKPADRGTGLGLSTVHGIIEEVGGHIGVDSTPGIGTTFRILLPLANDPADPPTCPGPDEDHLGHGELVAVIEDEDAVRDLVVRILREHGYRTVAASRDPGTDLDVALLISDVELRDGSGPAVAERLRAVHPGLPVLFMSGYHEVDTAEPVLRKPFTAAELLAAVAGVLPAKYTLSQ